GNRRRRCGRIGVGVGVGVSVRRGVLVSRIIATGKQYCQRGYSYESCDSATHLCEIPPLQVNTIPVRKTYVSRMGLQAVGRRHWRQDYRINMINRTLPLHCSLFRRVDFRGFWDVAEEIALDVVEQEGLGIGVR